MGAALSSQLCSASCHTLTLPSFMGFLPRKPPWAAEPARPCLFGSRAVVSVASVNKPPVRWLQGRVEGVVVPLFWLGMALPFAMCCLPLCSVCLRAGCRGACSGGAGAGAARTALGLPSTAPEAQGAAGGTAGERPGGEFCPARRQRCGSGVPGEVWQRSPAVGDPSARLGPCSLAAPLHPARVSGGVPHGIRGVTSPVPTLSSHYGNPSAELIFLGVGTL